MLLEMYLKISYRIAPTRYLEVGHRWYSKRNPGFMSDVSDGLPYDWWPLILFRLGRQYVEQGGRGTYPLEPKALDALLRHASEQRETAGPIRDSLVALRLLHDEAFREGNVETHLKRTLAPLLNRYPRLKGTLDLDDLVQEAVAASAEVAKDPAITWTAEKATPYGQDAVREVTLNVGNRWPTSDIRPTPAFIRRVTERLVSRKYGADRQLERGEKSTFDEPPPSTDNSLDAVEWRMVFDRLSLDLPPKQREVFEVKLRAEIEGVSLAEMSRKLGRNPKLDRENFKALQRSGRSKALLFDD